MNSATSTALTVVSNPSESSLTIQELPTLLKRWMTLQTEINSFNTELKQRRTQSKALREAILGVMGKHNVVQLNVSKGSVIHKTIEKKESLSAGYLAKAAKDFFEGDEVKAAQLVKYLEEHRASTVVHDLRFAGAKDGASVER